MYNNVRKTAYIPHDCYDLSRAFVATKDSVLSRFALTPLATPSSDLELFPTYGMSFSFMHIHIDYR